MFNNDDNNPNIKTYENELGHMVIWSKIDNLIAFPPLLTDVTKTSLALFGKAIELMAELIIQLSGSPNWPGPIFSSFCKIRSQPVSLLKFIFVKFLGALVTYFLEGERNIVLQIYLKIFNIRVWTI